MKERLILMKYNYTILLELESKEKNAGKRLQEYAGLLQGEAVEHFNDKAARTRKPKEIRDVKVADYTVTIELESAEQLVAPFKSMRSYSQYLMNNGMGELADDNALFRSVSVKEVEIEDEGMTDERLLNYMLHMVLRRSKKDLELIEEIKKLISERAG